jgi:Na+-translocating ferredoxin:NAD+ oxidoreductase RnfD subunit
LLAGGLLFGAFFMATDPVTSPMSNGGKWAYGLIIGVATALIRNLTGYVEGVMFAILLGNIFAPVLDEFFVTAQLRKLRGYKT